MNNITVFKIRIDSISETAIRFEIKVGERVADTYVNMLASGNYGVTNRLVLTPKQFSDFAIRLVAYTYCEKDLLTDEQVKVLWGLKLNIFDNETHQLSKSLFQDKIIRSQLFNLGLIKQ